jgi:hypothetical protein
MSFINYAQNFNLKAAVGRNDLLMFSLFFEMKSTQKVVGT